MRVRVKTRDVTPFKPVTKASFFRYDRLILQSRTSSRIFRKRYFNRRCESRDLRISDYQIGYIINSLGRMRTRNTIFLRARQSRKCVFQKTAEHAQKTIVGIAQFRTASVVGHSLEPARQLVVAAKRGPG